MSLILSFAKKKILFDRQPHDALGTHRRRPLRSPRRGDLPSGISRLGTHRRTAAAPGAVTRLGGRGLKIVATDQTAEAPLFGVNRVELGEQLLRFGEGGQRHIVACFTELLPKGLHSRIGVCLSDSISG